MTVENLIADINRLRQERRAVILSHTYQAAEVQDIADYVGDSYGLSLMASQITDAEVIVFCGVQFMAETAAILNPDRVVLMPDPTAGCPMADMITAEQLRQFKAEHPGAAVVCYVNSTAEVKAESDVCCTSANAVEIIQSMPEATEILFVPDQYLGYFVEKRLSRKLTVWPGFCPTHYTLGPETISRMKKLHPQAKVMVHPETRPETQDAADFVLSTGQMIELVKKEPAQQYLVGTEEGILHTLKKASPNSDFIKISDFLRCPNMKKTTLAKIKDSLENLQTRITVPEEIARKAKKSIDRMLELTAKK